MFRFRFAPHYIRVRLVEKSTLLIAAECDGTGWEVIAGLRSETWGTRRPGSPLFYLPPHGRIQRVPDSERLRNPRRVLALAELSLVRSH